MGPSYTRGTAVPGRLPSCWPLSRPTGIPDYQLEEREAGPLMVPPLEPPLCSPLTLQPWDQLCPPRGGSVGKLRAAVSLRGHSHSWEEALEPGTWGGTGLVGECRVQAGLLDFSLTVRNLLPPCPSCWAPWGWASCPHCTRCPEEV